MSPYQAPHPIVGVLGGMGPEATVDFMRRVIAATPARDDADHIHMIVDCNPKIPSRIAALIDGTGASPAPELKRMARSLEAQGASVLAMPCNTAHHYAAQIEAAVAIPLLSMPLFTARTLSEMGLQGRKIGLLASSAVVKLDLYGQILKPFGMACVAPAAQAQLMDIIRGIKKGDSGTHARAQFAEIGQSLIAAGCDALLIACTELSLFAQDLPSGQPIIDSLDVLARETCAFVQQSAKARPPGAKVAQ